MTVTVGAGVLSSTPAPCVHCGRSTRLTNHGWGHCVVFARINAADQHRAAPSRHMAKLWALRCEVEL